MGKGFGRCWWWIIMQQEGTSFHRERRHSISSRWDSDGPHCFHLKGFHFNDAFYNFNKYINSDNSEKDAFFPFHSFFMNFTSCIQISLIFLSLHFHPLPLQFPWQNKTKIKTKMRKKITLGNKKSSKPRTAKQHLTVSWYVTQYTLLSTPSFFEWRTRV